MLGKVIQITIPEKEEIPEYMNTFSPEENFLMIKIGSQCLKEARVAIAGLSQKEIYEKIQAETKVQRERLELDLLVERETHKKVMDHMEEKIQAIYNESEARLKKRNEKLEEMNQGLREQLKSYEVENENLVKEEIKRERERIQEFLSKKEKEIENELIKQKEKYDLLLMEKDTQNRLNREVFDKALQLTNKTLSKKGAEGEETFGYYAETFKDFPGFDLIDKHTQGGQGDFHMHFDEFDILVDAKNYKKGVPSREREKIKGDLLNNHMNFAWLVSLNSTIDKFDKSPIMFEWVSTTKCICYINHLLQYEDPSKILRIAWFSCKELLRLIEDNDSEDESELTALKENQFKMNNKIKNVRKIIREINLNIGIFKKQIESIDFELKDLLEIETNQLVESNFSLFNNWWNENIIPTTEESILVSTEIWFRFKQENKEIIKEFDLNPDKFRQYIKTKLPMTSYSIRGKKGEGSYDIKGITWKPKPMEEKEEEKPKTKKIVKEKEKVVKVKTETLKSFYLNEKEDNEILKFYQEDLLNIMEISERINVRPWQIVSLLMKYEIIQKRDESRGYDIYKETEEYKQKCVKK
jgi:hypothetical protein